MVWIIILIFLLLILCWFLLAPLELKIDTRTPQASLRWISIGKAKVVYEQEKWLLKIRVWFFSKQWELEKLIFGKKKKNRIKKATRKRKSNKNKRLRRFLSVVKTFRVTKWQIAMDTGDSIQNAWLYPLNFFPYTRHHLYINFEEENYLLLKVRNVPWKLVYAFMK
jgi:hypothetical protein